MKQVGKMQPHAREARNCPPTLQDEGAGNSPSRPRRVGRVRLVRRGRRVAHKLGSKELHTVPVRVGISVAHGKPTPPAPLQRRVIGSSKSQGHCRGVSLTNSHTDEAQTCLGGV